MFAVFEEKGGAGRNTGDATVVCNGDGSSLRPYRTSSRADGTPHAEFYVTDEEVVSPVYFGSPEPPEHQAYSTTPLGAPSHLSRGVWVLKAGWWSKENSGIPRLSEVAYYNAINGERDLVPAEYVAAELDGAFAFLRPAVEAAMDKAQCYHCRCVHYGADG